MRSDLTKLRHARSKKDFPDISLEENEYVVLKIKRSGVIPILVWTGVILATIFFISLHIMISNLGTGTFAMDSNSQGFFGLIITVVFSVILISALISMNVYSNNKLFVTNKRIIQKTQSSLFSSSTNVIDLISIEDVSFKQSGLFEHITRVGTLRMSTVGDETTYTFKYVDSPVDELETITHLVHVEKQENEVKIRTR